MKLSFGPLSVSARLPWEQTNGHALSQSAEPEAFIASDYNPSPVDTSEAEKARQANRELGSSSRGLVFREYNSALMGPRGLRTYDKMRRSDATVRSTLRLIKAPIVSAQWYVEPASDSDIDLEIAAFVEWSRTRMSKSWTKILWEALLMLDYGWYALEKVYEWAEWRAPESTRGRRRKMLTWQKLAPRHPTTLYEWEYDANGGVNGFWQDTGDRQRVFLPIEKLLLFTFDEESGDPEGMSVLRSAYKHWYYKESLYKIDAIQKERHGIGVPKVRLPLNHTPADKTLAAQLGRNLRTNEKAEIVLLPGWEVDFAELKGTPVDVLASAEHHDLKIQGSMLTEFLTAGAGTSRGAAGNAPMIDVFLKAQRYVADLVAETFNQFCVRQLVDYNFPNVDKYPRLRVRRIGENADWRAFSVAVRNLIEGGLVTPDPTLEAWIRDQMDLPRPGKKVLARDVEDRVGDDDPPVSPPTNDDPLSPPGPNDTRVPPAPPNPQGGGNTRNRKRKPKDF